MSQAKTGHQLFSAEEMFSWIEQCEQSELSVKAFCELHQIAPSNYYYWRKKHRSQDAEQESEPTGFSFVRVEEGDSVSGLFAEVNGIKIFRPVSASFLRELAS